MTLECHSEAFPKSINFWVNNKGAMLVSSKHQHHHHDNGKYKDCESMHCDVSNSPSKFSDSKYEAVSVDSGYKVVNFASKISIVTVFALPCHKCQHYSKSISTTKNCNAVLIAFNHLSHKNSFLCHLQLSMCTGLYEVAHPQHHQRGLHGVSLRGEKLSGRLRWLYNSLW